jgi:hypothetical protein
MRLAWGFNGSLPWCSTNHNQPLHHDGRFAMQSFKNKLSVVRAVYVARHLHVAVPSSLGLGQGQGPAYHASVRSCTRLVHEAPGYRPPPRIHAPGQRYARPPPVVAYVELRDLSSTSPQKPYLAPLTRASMEQFSDGWVSTVHSMQGGECERAVVFLDGMFNRMFYTAVTRAKTQCCVIICDDALRALNPQPWLKGPFLTRSLRATVCKAVATQFHTRTTLLGCFNHAPPLARRALGWHEQKLAASYHELFVIPVFPFHEVLHQNVYALEWVTGAMGSFLTQFDQERH